MNLLHSDSSPSFIKTLSSYNLHGVSYTCPTLVQTQGTSGFMYVRSSRDSVSHLFYLRIVKRIRWWSFKRVTWLLVSVNIPSLYFQHIHKIESYSTYTLFIGWQVIVYGFFNDYLVLRDPFHWSVGHHPFFLTREDYYVLQQ